MSSQRPMNCTTISIFFIVQLAMPSIFYFGNTVQMFFRGGIENDHDHENKGKYGNLRSNLITLYGVGENTHSFEMHFHSVTVLQEDRRIAKHSHPGRGSSDNDIAGKERHLA